MKNFFSLCSLLVAALAFSQSWQGQGDQKIQVGMNLYGRGTGIKLNYDYGIARIVSVGAGSDFYFSQKNNKEIFSLYGRLNFHLNDALKLSSAFDLYPGISVGIMGGLFDFSAHVGLRFFITDRIGIFGEFGNRGGLGVSIDI